MYYETDYLAHYGVLGQKWGVRRYQNKDGTLTAEGKKRVKELKGKDTESLSSNDKKLIEASKKEISDKLQRGKQEKEKRKKQVENGKIKVEDMTAEEIKARMERIQLEKDYKTLISESKTKDGDLSMGKRFSDKFKKSLVDKLASDVGADLIAQVTKAVLAEAINKSAGKTAVYTNNQKKK